MNKQILLTLSADELETRIRDITNELNQEWHLDRRMRLSTFLKDCKKNWHTVKIFAQSY